MSASAERARLLTVREQKVKQGYRDIIAKIPDAVKVAQRETETSDLATTPEGKFALTYLLAAQRLLTPALHDMTQLNIDLLQPIGGPEYNPHRSIDDIGAAVAKNLVDTTTTIPNFWLHTEESASWERASTTGDDFEHGETFAVIDPLDMTHSITKSERTQTTGIVIFDRDGNMKAVGLASVVDDGFIFIERGKENDHVFASPPQIENPQLSDTEPIHIATLTRRMYDLRSLPIFTSGIGERVLDSTSGFAVLSLHNGTVDTILDPVKGNPWYETIIWGTIADELGMPITDRHNVPLDLGAMMRRVIQKHEDDQYRIPFVISRTPEIHQKVLTLLTPTK